MSPLFLVLGQESSDRRLTGAGRSRRPVLRNLLHGQWSAILYNYNVRNVNKKLSTPRIKVHWIAGWKRKYVYFGDRIEIGQCKIESNNSITRDQG